MSAPSHRHSDLRAQLPFKWQHYWQYALHAFAITSKLRKWGQQRSRYALRSGKQMNHSHPLRGEVMTSHLQPDKQLVELLHWLAADIRCRFSNTHCLRQTEHEASLVPAVAVDRLSCKCRRHEESAQRASQCAAQSRRHFVLSPAA